MMAGTTGNFGCGATGVCDGVDTGAWIATMETDIGNWEVWELFVPEMYMSRMLEPYSVGCGRYRSGLSMPTMDMLHRVTIGIGSGASGAPMTASFPTSASSAATRAASGTPSWSATTTSRTR